jgi:hypothetical protein
MPVRDAYPVFRGTTPQAVPRLAIVDSDGEWTMHLGTYEAESWNELLRLLMSRGRRTVIYRGHGQARWALTCTLVRRMRDSLPSDSRWAGLMESNVRDEGLDDHIKRSERRMLRVFMDRAEELRTPDLPARDDRLAWWELMQHHGTPTRLLDWSRSPFVALWFAMADAVEGEDSALWIFDTRNSTINYQEVSIHYDREALDTRAWQNKLAERAMDDRSQVPLVLETSRNLARAVAQQSVVTLIPDPGPSIASSAHLFEEMAVKIPIPMEWRDSIRRALESMGITRSSLMMDLDSTGAELSLSLGF